MRWKVLLVALPLLACGKSTTGGDSGNTASAMIAMGQSAVRERLRDPSSAVFRNEKIGRVGNNSVVCGEVNANNGFGGKTGYRRYISNGADATVTEEIMEPAEFAKAWAATGC